MDGFDLLPDPIILLIFTSVTDVKSLLRCRSVSKRFNSLVPQTDSLLLRVDRVISPDSDHHPLLLLSFLKSLLDSIHDLFTSDLKSSSSSYRQNSPAQILSQFHRIRRLQIELPAGDLKLDKGIAIKWRADFGKTLRSCVIFGYGGDSGELSGADDFGLAGGLKARVVWTISALIAASARHYLLKDVVEQHEELEHLVLKDKEEEGTVVMEEEGLRECREEMAAARGGEWEWEASRTVVPSVRIRMKYEGRVRLKSGKLVEGATLVVVRSCSGKDDATGGGGVDSVAEDGALAMEAFGGGMYSEVVQVLLNSKSYLLEMNSF